jgi:peroxin-16
VLLIRKYGKKSFTPWILSLFIELGCMSTRFNFITNRWSLKLSSLEKDEAKRRRFQFVYYLLREPIYSNFVVARLNSFANFSANKPILSVLGRIFTDYKDLWEKYYFYKNQ